MIEIKNVTFHYSGLDQAGLCDFNLSVTDGECILLCGASGCGKTTVTRLINGLIPHFFKGELTGDVYVNGLDIKQQELYNLAGIVGSVFQNPRSQFFSVDTDGEVVFGPENIGLPKPEILTRKKQVVQELNLNDLLGRSLFDLSGGEKQKIACASVAALLPDIIILDEPSSNLDWAAIRDLRDAMQLWKSQGKMIIISEHRLWYLKDIIDRAVYMEKGRIVNEWTRQEFSQLTEKELKSYELRPVTLEERYIRQFSNVSKSGNENPADQRNLETGIDGDELLCLTDFYFTYTPRKYLFVKKKLTPEDEEICDLRIPHLQIEKGKIVGVIGDNGSGKSTFLRCLCGLEKTCIGTVEVSGRTYHGRQLTKICYMVMQDVNHQLFTNSVLSEVLPVYFFTRGAIGNSAAVLLMIGLMMPFFFFAMYERDGQPAEKILKNRLRYKLWPKDRPYRTDNLYKSMSKKEVTKIAKKQAAGSSGKASAKKHQAGQKDQSRCKAGQN